MNELITKQQAIAIHEINGEPTMSSLRIAEVTNKRHSDVLRDIEKVFSDCGIEERKFALNYKSDNNRAVKHYLLPEREFNLVVSGYSAKYRLQLIDELMSYRKSKPVITTPSTYIEALKALVESEEAKERAIKAKQLAEAKRNLLIHQNKRYTASELAGELGIKSAMKFNAILHNNNIQYKVGGTWKLYAKYEALGYADYKQVELDSGKVIYQMRWTGIGRDFILDTFMKSSLFNHNSE